MQTARTLWRTLEAIHATIYFSPIAMDAYKGIGIGEPGFNYFAPRAAAMGTVEGGVVAATFYFWAPSHVGKFIPAAWELASPATVTAARWGAAGDVVRSRAGAAINQADAEEAVGLLSRAMGDVSVVGRPLYGGHVSVPEPTDAVAAVWHWATLYREYRGDGHIAALQTLGLGPIEALLLNVATGYFPEERQRRTRAWGDEAWATTRARLVEGGILAEPDGTLVLTDGGRELANEVEQLTNQLSATPWISLGMEASERIVTLLEPWADAIVAADGVAYRRPDA
jgi:hypothetical protein